ncbi:protein S100-P-like [Mixophyes fleayi]|uniref:protein S100-P-like n=1 Tax=Mixophyes fleayi TaxID=3061075 RepID=UPI003F4DFF1E
MTQLEKAMVMMIDVFDKYASTEGNKNTLTKGEVKSLMEKELPGMLQKAKDKDACDKIMKHLDENGNSELDFKEFIALVAALTIIGHERFGNKPQKK